MIATKFVEHEIPPLEYLKDSRVYKIKMKVENNEKLTREEKNYVTKEIQNNTYFRRSIPLRGWKFNFDRILKRFVVGQYEPHCAEYFAVDKTALRACLSGKIRYIVEVK